MDNPVVLSINDVVIRKCDLEILKGKDWINDSIIGLCFDHYENRQFAGEDGYLFVSPEVTQCVKIVPEGDMPLFLDPLRAKEKDVIFFPLNDCMDILSSGGSHWSLLVYSRKDKIFCHYDSLVGRNSCQANDMARKILVLREHNLVMETKDDLSLFYLGHVKRKPSHKKNSAIEIETLQQRNYFDCGIHVLCNAELIANHMQKSGTIYGSGKVKPMVVSKKRADLLMLIEDLRETLGFNGEN